MKKTKIAAALAVASAMVMPLALTACDGGHEHTFDTNTWVSSGAEGHYHPATCEHTDVHDAIVPHVYDDANDATCNLCDYVRELTTTPAVEQGTISGTVTANGNALVGVKVAVGTVDTTTSATGKYSLANIEIKDSVTVTFSKDGYRTVTKTIAKADWQNKTATLDAEMQLAAESTTVSGVIMAGTRKVEGATVTVGGKSATTDANGEYSIADVSIVGVTELDITVSHAACETFTGKVSVASMTENGITKNVGLTTKTVSCINKTFFDLLAMQTSDTTDFVHRQNTEMWHVEHGPDGGGTRVIIDHGEGICLHVDNNATLEEMVPAIYQRLSITADNCKMMFRARGFLGNSDKAGLLAVRVVNLSDGEVDELNGENGEFWQVMDSNGYIQYRYDFSEYKGKDVVVIIGAKQGNHNAIERIRFIGENEDWLMPFTTAADISSLTAVAAENLDGVDAIKNALGGNSWIKVGDQGGANEGWLFKDADYAEEGSTQLRVFAYKKLTFDNVGTFVVRARTFSGQNSVSSGHDGQIYPQIVIRLIDSDGNLVNVNGNCATVSNGESCENYYFTTETPLSGDYTFVVGMARGQRLAVEKILFRATSVKANVTGTVKVGGQPLAGATVSYATNRDSVVTAADGTFTLPVEIDDDITVTVSKEGHKSQTFTVSKTDVSDGVYAHGDISLVATILPGLTTDDVAALTALTDSSYNTNTIKEKWSQYGNVDKHNEGTCIHLDANNAVSYIYAKFAVTADTRYLKFKARRFVRNEDQSAGLQLKVIKADGTIETLAPTHVYRDDNNVISTNLANDGKTVINDQDAYTAGAYDLEAYVGQTVVITIQAVYLNNDGRAVHNAIDEIAFQATPFYN